eukprot:8418258-Heterocapsa_arctica.AAC.1
MATIPDLNESGLNGTVRPHDANEMRRVTRPDDEDGGDPAKKGCRGADGLLSSPTVMTWNAPAVYSSFQYILAKSNLGGPSEIHGIEGYLNTIDKNFLGFLLAANFFKI